MSQGSRTVHKFGESEESLKRHRYLSFIIPRPSTKPRIIELPQPRKNKWYEGCWNKLPSLTIRVARVGLFLGVTSMALFQTEQLLDDYVNQMPVSKIVPLQLSNLSRPNLVVCVNIFEIYLKNSYTTLSTERLRVAATLGLDYGTLFYNSRMQIFNVSDDKYPFVTWERVLYSASRKFSNCSDVLGVCNNLLSSWAGTAYNCCDNSTRWTTPESICHSVVNTHDQPMTGKANAAMYELLFPISSYDATYSLFLEHPHEWSNTIDQPVATMKSGMDVSIAIEMQKYSRLNTTSRKCTEHNILAEPNCGMRIRRHLVNQLCNCDAGDPIWTFNVSQWSNKDLDPGVPGNRTRPCRLLEDWLCLVERVSEYNQLTKKAEAQCFPSKCHTTSYPQNTMTSKLAPYFTHFPNNRRKNHSYSTLYLFYGTLTITQYFEVYRSTWMGLLSNLGGVWGLWLGWSLFQAANLLLSVIGKGVKKK